MSGSAQVVEDSIPTGLPPLVTRDTSLYWEQEGTNGINKQLSPKVTLHDRGSRRNRIPPAGTFFHDCFQGKRMKD